MPGRGSDVVPLDGGGQRVLAAAVVEIVEPKPRRFAPAENTDES
jgi:hypothetical protein